MTNNIYIIKIFIYYTIIYYGDAMDTTDRRILEALKENGRATASDISKSVDLSVPAVTERIRKLQETGIIEQYTVRINRAKMGYRLCAMIFVGIVTTADIGGFRSEIVHCPEVIECHHIAGEYDYLLKVIVEDTNGLERFLSKRLKSIRGVAKTNTIVVLSTLKERVNR